MTSNNLFNIELSPKLATYLINNKEYEKIRKLGKGSYGRVDLVKNVTTNDKFALKTINFNYDFSDDDVQSFYREVEIMAECNHPSVLRLNGFSLPTKKREYATILTPYMPKGSLENLLKDSEVDFNLSRKLIIIFGVAAGMQYLHHMNVIHRDLKPGNILLNDNYEPYIGDFGFSKMTETQNSIKQSMTGGTPLYMAPELYDNYTYGFKVDVYAFGMLLYEVLSGVEPFEDLKNPNSIPLKVCNGARPNIPSFVQKPFTILIKSCWSSNPSERPTFDEIVERLLNIDLLECIREDHGLSRSNKKDDKSDGKKKKESRTPKKSKGKSRSQYDSEDGYENEDSDGSSAEFDDEEEEKIVSEEYASVKRYIERVLSQPYIFSTLSKLSNETKTLTKRVKSLESTVQSLLVDNMKLNRMIKNILKSVNSNDNSNSVNDDEYNDDATDSQKDKKNSKFQDISDIKSDGYLINTPNRYIPNNRQDDENDNPYSDYPKNVAFNPLKNYITISNPVNNGRAMTPQRKFNNNKLDMFNYCTANDFLKKDLRVKFDSHHGIIETLKSQQRSPFEKIVIESQSSGDIYQIINSESADRYTSSVEGNSWIQFRFPEPIQLFGIKLTSSRNHFIRSWRFIALVESTGNGKTKAKKNKGKVKNKKKGDSDDDEYSSENNEYEYEYEYDFSCEPSRSAASEEEEEESASDDSDGKRKKDKKKKKGNNSKNGKRRNIKFKKIVVYENDNERQLNGCFSELKIKFANSVKASIYRIEQTGPSWNNDEAISLKAVDFQTKKGMLKPPASDDSDDRSDDGENSGKSALIDVFSTMLKSVRGDPHRANVLITSNDFDFESYQFINTDTCLQTYSRPAPSWFQVEFSHGTLQTFGYRIRRNDQMMLKSWSLVASNDKELKIEKWTVIHTITESKQGDLGLISTFKCKIKNFFKYFRIVQKCPCWDGSKFLVLYHFDLFGHYKEDFC